jgi:predicted histidine transporter YuiF (NhaC family)
MKNSNISEKERIINNYAMLSAFAHCMSIDGVDDKLIEQMKTQISTMGSNTIEKTVRLVFSMAM